MIKVRRVTPKSAREALEKKGRSGKTERQRAIGHFLRGNPAKLSGFSAYKAAVVKDELNAMFHKKCAYCESRYAHVAPVDVEHFRPKSGFINNSGKLVRPGYYWLTAEWTNLLPSCIDCNRKRKQIILSEDGQIDERNSGKGNKFPLASGSRRAKRPNQHNHEVPLLLDPCSDDRPNRHLQFTDSGFVRPYPGSYETSMPKGATTIEVCGLNRDDLVRERKQQFKELQSDLKGLCTNELNAREDPANARFQKLIADYERDIKKRLKADQPYIGMSRAMVSSFRRILRLVNAYWTAVASLDATPNSAAKQRLVSKHAKALKRHLNPNRIDADLARSVMEWCELESLLPE